MYRIDVSPVCLVEAFHVPTWGIQTKGEPLDNEQLLAVLGTITEDELNACLPELYED